MQLRDYQVDALNAVRQSLVEGNKSPLLVAPCGSGKTGISCEIMRLATTKHRPVLFICPRRQLVYQTIEALQEFDINAGAIMVGERRSVMSDVQVASINTLHRRIVVGGKKAPRAKLIIIDEAHACMGKMMQDILELYPDVPRVCMTATPARSDGRGLGELCDDMVMGPTMPSLIADGFLLPVRYYAPSKYDLSQVRTTAGDYNLGDLDKAVNEPKLIGDVVENWSRIAPDRKTVVFAVNRKHAKAIQNEFIEFGVSSEYIDGNTPNEERKAILHRIRTGRSQVLCSVDVVSYGWNEPSISCGIIARPTKSLPRYIQGAGRILRPFEGQTDAILIDHSGVVEALGFIEDEQPWSLEGKEKIQDRKQAAERKNPKPIECPECKLMFEPRPTCPDCGHNLSVQFAKHIKTHDAELREVARKGKKSKANTMTMDEKIMFFSGLKYVTKTKGYKPGFAAVMYKEKLGVWPNHPSIKNAPASYPADDVWNWVQYQLIKSAKKRKKKLSA